MKILKKIWLRDWLVNLLLAYILISDIFFIISFKAEMIIFGLPFILLSIIFFPFIIFIFSPCMIIYDSGIKLRQKYLPWNEIKSISFSSGRFRDTVFWRGLKLPATQRIYVLDMKGNEYNTIIDLDHSLKINRSSNNISIISEVFHLTGRANILSDWAEKR